MQAHNLRAPRGRLANLALGPRQIIFLIRRAAHLDESHCKFICHSASPLSIRMFRVGLLASAGVLNSTFLFRSFVLSILFALESFRHLSKSLGPIVKRH